MHDHTGTVVVTVVEEAVAVHTVAESDTRLANEVVLTSKRPAWYWRPDERAFWGVA